MSCCNSMNKIADTFTLFAPRWAQSLIHSLFSKLFHWKHWFFIVHSHFSASQAKPWFSFGFLIFGQKSLFQNADTVALVLHLDLQSMDTFALFLYHFFIHQQNRAKSLIHSHFSQGLQISIIENEQKRWYIRVFWWGSYFLTTSLAVCEEREKTQAESSVLIFATHFCWAPLQPNRLRGQNGLSRRRNPLYTCAASPLWWFALIYIQRKP